MGIEVLTASASNYLDSKGKKLENYEMRGVHIVAIVNEKSFEQLIALQAPEGTEVIVSYNPQFVVRGRLGLVGYLSGTALIPRNK